MRQAWFIARKDLAIMLRHRETLMWVFLMPILFFYFIGTVTGGSDGPVGDQKSPLAVRGSENGGFLVDELLRRLEAQNFEIVRPSSDAEFRAQNRRLIIPAPAAGYGSFTDAVLARQPQARVVSMSAEKFMVEFIRALRENDTIGFKSRLRSADLLLIDDVQFIAGKDSTQEEFFHTMNEIITAGRRLVITSDRAPQDLDGIAPRILSRLSWGLVADINPADYELRLNIIDAKLAVLPGVEMPRQVVEFLAGRLTNSIRELEGALNRIAAYALMTGRTIDLPFVEEVLANVLRANQRRISIDEIQTQVAEHYRIRKAEMTSARRAREVARPRQVAMYLSKQLTPKSLPDIGRRFGGRDHTTVIHAVRQIERLRASDAELDADILLDPRERVVLPDREHDVVRGQELLSDLLADLLAVRALAPLEHVEHHPRQLAALDDELLGRVVDDDLDLLALGVLELPR